MRRFHHGGFVSKGREIEIALLCIAVVAAEAVSVEDGAEVRCGGSSRDENGGEQWADHALYQ